MTAHFEEHSPFDYVCDRSLGAKIRRRVTQRVTIKPLQPVRRSIITFSFDDFPKSAADAGAEIIESIGAKAVYYTSSGLRGITLQTGEQYEQDDLLRLITSGHEIGAHTHTHLDCSAAPVDIVIADIEHNLSELKAMGLDTPVEHFAYPYGEATIHLKKALKGKFSTCRGIMPGFNKTSSDSLQLKAMELKPDGSTTDRALHAIEVALTRPVWLHIFTHDIRQKPSDYGTTPASLMQVARRARDSQLPILTPSAALRLLSGAENG